MDVQDLTFTKAVDTATGPIMLGCCTGDHIPEVVLLIRKAGSNPPQKHVTITMKKCMVTAVSTGGSEGEVVMTENVTLNFAEVLFEYFVQDDKGVTSNSGKLGWNIEADKNTG